MYPQSETELFTLFWGLARAMASTKYRLYHRHLTPIFKVIFENSKTKSASMFAHSMAWSVSIEQSMVCYSEQENTQGNHINDKETS